MTHHIALLKTALALQPDTTDVLLVPAGEFVGRDGRPGKGLTWKLTDAQGAALAAKLTARHQTVRFNFDYEHQMMLAEENGQPAPASGWVSEFAWRPAQGLVALNVRWTARAKGFLDTGEYAYISPVLRFDKKTGQVLDVVNAALTNNPSLEQSPISESVMARLSQLPLHQPENETTMNEVLIALLKSLGLPATEATTADQATAAVAALKAKADQADTATTELAALKAKPKGEVDPTKFVSLEDFTKLSTELAALTAKHVGSEVDALLAAATAEGKCPPVVETVWRAVGNKDLAQLKALIAATPANPALAGQKQTDAKDLGGDNKAAATAEELAMCRNMGLSLEEFRKGAA